MEQRELERQIDERVAQVVPVEPPQIHDEELRVEEPPRIDPIQMTEELPDERPDIARDVKQSGLEPPELDLAAFESLRTLDVDPEPFRPLFDPEPTAPPERAVGIMPTVDIPEQPRPAEREAQRTEFPRSGEKVSDKAARTPPETRQQPPPPSQPQQQGLQGGQGGPRASLRESLFVGGGADGSQYAAILAQLAVLDARLTDAEDDRAEERMFGGGGGGGGAFNGVAYRPDGTFVETNDDPDKPWVLYRLSTNTITEEVGPPSSPWGTDEIWRKKSDFRGAIYF